MASDDSQRYKMQKVIEYKRRTAKEWLEMLTSQKILSEDVNKEIAEIAVLYFAQEEVNGSK
jgi:hypothetical protein